MRPHRTDPLSLGFGLFFLLVAGWWGLYEIGVEIPLIPIGWIVAILLIIIGVTGLVAAARDSGTGRRR